MMGALELVSLVMTVVVALDISGASLSRQGILPRSVSFLTRLLFTLLFLGATLLAIVLKPQGISHETLSAYFLYGTLTMLYVQAKSIFSRGYSIRILVDLKGLGGKCTLDQLKKSYGGGMGVEGLLSKRLRFVSALNLAQVAGNQYGPLSGRGRALAKLCKNLRRLLRLEMVG